MKPNIHTVVAEGWGAEPIIFDKLRGALAEEPCRVTGGCDYKGVTFRITLRLDNVVTVYYTCRVRVKRQDFAPHTWTTAGFADTADEAELRAVDRLRRCFGAGFPQPALTTGPRQPVKPATGNN